MYDVILRGRYCFPASERSGTTREARDFNRWLLRTDPSKRMTVEEALNHPWMVRHLNKDAMYEDSKDNSSVEVVFKGLPRRDSITCDDTVV